MKKSMIKWRRLLYSAVACVAFCSCGNSSSNSGNYGSSSYTYTEDHVVTSDSFVDGNGQISFRGNSLKLVWKNKYRDGHQFRAYIKPGHQVVSTTKCAYCNHDYFVHYDK